MLCLDNPIFVCTIEHMNIQTQLEEYHQLTNLLYSLGKEPQKSRRVQLKMPAAVVEMLDQKFPKINRSRLLTQAALELLIRKTRSNRPDLEQWLASEQEDLDVMWSYLNYRDQKPKVWSPTAKAVGPFIYPPSPKATEGLSAYQLEGATSCRSRRPGIHQWVNPWSSAKADKTGEIYLVRFHPSAGADLKKYRPPVVISPQVNRADHRFILIAPLTSGGVVNRRYEMPIKKRANLVKDSTILVWYLRTIDISRLSGKIADLQPQEIKILKKKLINLMDRK